MLMTNLQPIGFFDSGLGGLSIMQHVRKLLPGEDLVYVADSLHCPYGTKSTAYIGNRALAISHFLLSRGIKLITVASNTTTTASMQLLRRSLTIPVVGVEPALKPAASMTKTGRIGILATQVTISGSNLDSLVKRHAHGVEVYTQPCPGLVELVESGQIDDQAAQQAVNYYLQPLLNANVDIVVLGCTHYPFLRHLVEAMAGPGITVLDTGEAVARQVQRLLTVNNLLNPSTAPGQEVYFTTGDPEVVTPAMRKLLQKPAIQVGRLSC